MSAPAAMADLVDTFHVQTGPHAIRTARERIVATART
jgi:hypothetical protein